MKMTREDADTLLKGLGFKFVERWDDEDVLTLLRKLPFLREGKVTESSDEWTPVRRLTAAFAWGEEIQLEGEANGGD